MMMEGDLSCASCHGPDARGGRHLMHMEVMDAPGIRWSALVEEGHEGEEREDYDHEDEHVGEYDLETFRRAVGKAEATIKFTVEDLDGDRAEVTVEADVSIPGV